MRYPGLVTVVALTVVVASAGFAGIATADDSGHDPPTATHRSQYELPPIEGPGSDPSEPDRLEVIVVRSCFPTHQIAGECVDNGLAVWQTCDNWQHATAGGRPQFDITCSTAEPYDHVTVDVQPRIDLGRQIPFAIVECGPDDVLCAEGSNGGFTGYSNDGEGDLDLFPGPKEIGEEACSRHPSSTGITVPAGDVAPDDGNLYPTYGTGDGLVTQAGETYTTHHRGTYGTLPDNVESIDNVDGDTGGTGIDFSEIDHPGDLKHVPHPGIARLEVVIRGAIHGPANAPCVPSRVPTVQGDVVVTLS